MGLTNCEKLGYGTGHAFNDLCSTLWFTYSLLYYKKVLGFSGYIAGAIMFIGQAADATATPVIGVLTDRTSLFSKWGKKKSWHLLGTVGVLASLPFMYSPAVYFRSAEQWIKFAYYCLFVVLFQFSWSVVQVAHLAIATVLSADHIERTQLFSIRNSFTFLSSIFTYIISWAVLCQKGSQERLTENDSLKFMTIVLIICVVGSLLSLIYYLTVKEKEHEAEIEREELVERTRLPMKDVFTKILFYQAAIVFTSSRVFCSVSQSFLNLYLNGDLKMNKECIATIPLLINIVSFIASCTTTKMNQAFGRKVTFTIGCAIGLVSCVWIWYGHGETYKKYGIYTVALLLGVAYPIQLVTSLAVTADVIGKDVGNSAFIYGIMSFVEKLTNGVAIFAIECLAPDETENLQSSTFYRNSIVFSCSIAMSLGLFCIITINTNYKNY